MQSLKHCVLQKGEINLWITQVGRTSMSSAIKLRPMSNRSGAIYWHHWVNGIIRHISQLLSVATRWSYRRHDNGIWFFRHVAHDNRCTSSKYIQRSANHFSNAILKTSKASRAKTNNSDCLKFDTIVEIVYNLIFAKFQINRSSEFQDMAVWTLFRSHENFK